METVDSFIQYNLFYEVIEKPAARRLKQVSNRLNVTPDELRILITNAGGIFEKNSNPLITHEHLQIIAKAYVKSVKTLYRRAKKAGKKGLAHGLSKNYFINFLEPEYLMFSLSYDVWELDDELIEKAFYKMIDSPVVRVDSGSWVLKKILNLMLRIVFSDYYLDLKSLIKSILSPQLFFTYTSEEDNNKVANFRKASLLA